ncbi:MAG: ribosome biogenesis GTPase YqeH [Candidatus Izemoplasma sp.]|nr:ribosome biogenesis GTPase YqeH [Candidatus Izemoplasma sp.]
MDYKCIGCGSTLQSDDQNQPGFVPGHKLDALADNPDEEIVCKRCFKLMHYNEVMPTSINEDTFFQMLNRIPKHNALIVHLVDMFDIEGTLIPQINRLTNHNELVIVGNKIDLLPKSVRHNKLIHNLKQICGENELKPSQVMVMSALKNYELDHVLADILDLAGQRDIYIVGMTNVGKSTFINHILKSAQTIDKDLITVSHHPGTTLDFIHIPIGDNEIIDTPGLMNNHSVLTTLSAKSRAMVNPNKEIKPKTYQLYSDQTLFLGGLARLEFSGEEDINVTVFVSNRLNIHRRKTADNDAFYDTHKYTLLTPPFKEEEDTLRKTYHLTMGHYKSDIVIPGLGFVTVRARAKVKVSTFKHVTPYVRKALI